jgi:hypothetical protein
MDLLRGVLQTQGTTIVAPFSGAVSARETVQAKVPEVHIMPTVYSKSLKMNIPRGGQGDSSILLQLGEQICYLMYAFVTRHSGRENDGRVALWPTVTSSWQNWQNVSLDLTRLLSNRLTKLIGSRHGKES